MITIETVKEIETELERFNERLKKAKDIIKKNSYQICGSKESGALKRSALDLRGVLTKITR